MKKIKTMSLEELSSYVIEKWWIDKIRKEQRDEVVARRIAIMKENKDDIKKIWLKNFRLAEECALYKALSKTLNNSLKEEKKKNINLRADIKKLQDSEKLTILELKQNVLRYKVLFSLSIIWWAFTVLYIMFLIYKFNQ